MRKKHEKRANVLAKNISHNMFYWSLGNTRASLAKHKGNLTLNSTFDFNIRIMQVVFAIRIVDVDLNKSFAHKTGGPMIMICTHIC